MSLTRRRWLAYGCAHCATLAAGGAWAVDDWQPPPRFLRPDLASDEGGLWAMVDREETKLRRSSFVMRDPALNDYLKAITCKLGGDHCADARVYAVRTPWFNASMFPNGMMQVWSGLLLRVENEAQLAAVMGHEIGHYLKRHSVERLRDAKQRSAFASVIGVFGLVGALGALGAVAGGAAFSREHEREADRIGLLLMARAGYDPREASRVWANLRAELAAGPAGDPSKKSALFASHPPSDERQATLAELAGEQTGFLGEAEYRERIEPFMWGLLDDELKRTQYDESIALITRLADKQPQRADLRYFRGEARRLRAKDEDLSLALADFDEALKLAKPPAQAYRSVGYIARQQGRKDDARSAFTRYLDAAPDAPDAGMIRNEISELQS